MYFGLAVGARPIAEISRLRGERAAACAGRHERRQCRHPSKHERISLVDPRHGCVNSRLLQSAFQRRMFAAPSFIV